MHVHVQPVIIFTSWLALRLLEFDTPNLLLFRLDQKTIESQVLFAGKGQVQNLVQIAQKALSASF